MSRGYAGFCRIEAEDKQTAIYSYRGENWNLPKDVSAKLEAEEGMFTVDKSCFIEPEVRRRIKKVRGKKKLVEKVIPVSVDVDALIEDGSISIDQLCGLDKRLKDKGDSLPYYIWMLLDCLFDRYQEEGEVPKVCGFVV